MHTATTTNRVDERLLRDLRSREEAARRERRDRDAEAIANIIARALAGVAL